MQRVSKIINKNIQKLNIEDKVLNYKVCGYWRPTIATFFPEAAHKTIALSFEKGTLRVASLSKEYTERINIYCKKIIYELNTNIGKELVFNIECEE